MKCVDVEKLLDDFVNDDLDFAVQRNVELHLHECPFCQSETEELQKTNVTLKNLAPIAPSKQFDERMLQAFRQHQQNQIKPSFWTAFFANFSISKPALACALLTFAVVSILAFQLGRITSKSTETAKTSDIIQTNSSENNLPVQIVEKRIEIPITKIIEVPIYKEKIVNRIIYKDREVSKPLKIPNVKENEIRDDKFDSQNTAVTYIQNGNETYTPINLKSFQPVLEIKMDVIKKGKDNEK